MTLITNLNLSFLSSIKLIFIAFFFILNIYLLYKEMEFLNNSDSPLEFRQMGIRDIPQSIKALGAFTVGGATLYGTGLTHFQFMERKVEINKQKEEAQNLINALEAEKSHEKIQFLDVKTKIFSKVAAIQEQLHNVVRTNEQSLGILDTVLKLKQKNEEAKMNKDSNPDSDSTYTTELEQAISRLKYLETEKRKSIEIVEAENEEIQNIVITKTSGIALDFIEYFKDLDIIAKLAFSLLFFNYALITATITIIFIYYGDYLIKRFDLENKYPKLAKLIQLRRKFQTYYFFVSVLVIASIIISETILCLFIILR